MVADEQGRAELLRADAYVVSLGSYSPMLLRPLGINLSIYPAKGYSVTLPVHDPSLAYQVSLTDGEYKLVFSRLGDRLRIAGTAELNGYSTALNQVRRHAIVRRVRELFRGMAKYFRCVRIVVGGIETVHMIAKGQMKCPWGPRLSTARQFYSLVSSVCAFPRRLRQTSLSRQNPSTRLARSS
ncbi:amino acid dehydrogenase [Pandoraea terrae]|uniref:Amino acid dehydrogenase n=1 Tax=Pandoraea terrae TaxID=1537710 RepID=A0A5E4XPU9_9BURK|nr:amino acid dehydrogenase [Pandoraea terrae]